MTTETKVQRLAAILYCAGTVTFLPYKGGGERTFRKGYRVASLGRYSGHGPSDGDALVKLADVLATAVGAEPARLMRESSEAQFRAQQARLAEATARKQAESAEERARQYAAMADTVTLELVALQSELAEK